MNRDQISEYLQRARRGLDHDDPVTEERGVVVSFGAGHHSDATATATLTVEGSPIRGCALIVARSTGFPDGLDDPTGAFVFIMRPGAGAPKFIRLTDGPRSRAICKYVRKEYEEERASKNG